MKASICLDMVVHVECCLSDCSIRTSLPETPERASRVVRCTVVVYSDIMYLR